MTNLLPTLKRQNFNITPEEEAQLQHLRETLGATSIKDALLRAARLTLVLSREVQEGKRIYSTDPSGMQTRLLLPDIEATTVTWNYLTSRPHSWKRQLYIKGRRLTAANVWYDMLANKRDFKETAENWELPVEAVMEIVRYCEANRELIGMDAEEEKRLMEDQGVSLVRAVSR